MPVIRADAVLNGQVREQLIDRLASELADDAAANPNGEPLAVELGVGQTQKIQAVVVWSEWDRVPWGERGRLIAAAYQRASPERFAALVAATGLTWDEADANAFFKFKIEPMARSSEVDPQAVRKAMLDEGAYLIRGALLLRFLTLDTANATYDRLQQTLPAGHWSIAAIIRNPE